MIEINNLSRYYGSQSDKVYALKNITLAIDRGDFVAIIGQSGSGKSTLLNILGCLDLPSSGSYKINDVEIANTSADKRAELRCKTFGFIFQRYNLLSDLSALENVVLPSIYYGLDAKTREEKSQKLLSDLNMGDRALHKPNELSGGQQQRVSIARALMNGGDIILADEPTGALDSKSGEKVMEIIKDLHKSGRTVILVTHDQKIASHANRIIEIKDGNIVSDTRNAANIYAHDKAKPSEIKNSFNYFARQFAESFKSSVKAVTAHKMRSFLTMLSIIIGITSVVCVIALGEGSKENIMDRIKSIGTNTVYIFPGAGFGDKDASKIKTLKPSDADILSRLSYVDNVSPIVTHEGLIIYKNKTAQASLQGVSAEFLELNGQKLESGRRFNVSEVKSAAALAIVDANTKKTLFGKRDPIGEIIIFNRQPLKIIGVMSKEDEFGPPTSNLEIYIPYVTAMYKVIGSQDIAGITVKISDAINSHLAEENLIKVLTAVHGKKDFFTLNSDSVQKIMEDMMNSLTLLISSIAFISLVVGGVGVMNIMLVSVTERTREIGVRMAIGAKRKNILLQFLSEAVLLSLIGGFIGVMLSLALALVFNSLTADFKMILSTNAILAALFFSSATGILFGYAPARNAANLNPIDALARD
ncbi:MAG: MacB family efflux pump subunit [Helicobacteraceae bacterium]|nr:MacB family efflux pump subunit [Helicobacteraceae bacterium]